MAGKRALALGILMAAAAAGAQSRFDATAVALNNRGVAQMGQQFTERASASFAEAFKKDPKLAQAAINEGISLLYLQKPDEARKWLEDGTRLDPRSPQGWYNLGLAQHAGNDLEAALISFRKATELDPRDADAQYFVGVCYRDQKQYEQAVAAFQKALTIEPLHTSAEFSLAQSLQRLGRTDEAKQHFRIFQHLSSTKISAPIGLAYGERGHYSTVATVIEAQPRPKAMIPVKLVVAPLTAPVSTSRPGAPSSEVVQNWATTGGACMMDVTGEGQMDLVLMQQGEQAIRVLHAKGDGSFADFDAASAGLKVKGHAVACAVGDFDGDEKNDLTVVLEDGIKLFRNLGKGKFEDVTEKSGLTAKNRPTGITFIDYDHDGFLDLFLTGSALAEGGSSNVLWRNNGNGTFSERTEQTGMGGSGRTQAAILTDFNNDRAVDIAVTGDGAAPTLYRNPREGKYPTQPLFSFANFVGISDEDFLKMASKSQVKYSHIRKDKNDHSARSESLNSTGIAVLDFDKDGWMDIAITHAGAPGVTLWRNVEAPGHAGRAFERVSLPINNAIRGWGLTPIDIDNDGWIDLAVLIETKAGAQVRVLRNQGDGSFADVSSTLGLDKVKLTNPRGLIAADVDGSGAAGLIITQLNAPPVLLRNVGGNKNHSVRLDLLGYADNKTALETKVEVFSNGQWQKFEVAGASGYATQGPQQLLVGLGDAEGIDLLRMLWPTGVLQDEVDLPHQKVVAMKEADRRGSSCPVLFTWNGKKYELVTDVIGAGVVGHWFTPTRHNTPNPGEWIKVEGQQAQPVHGRISLRFIEPMEEVNYIDQLRLVAVDHPENVEVNPDEKFLDDPPFASGKVVASAETRLPAAAWDGEGHDVLSELSRRDHQFASGFRPLPWDGFANLHALTLDLGAVQAQAPLRLLMTGYVNYFSATSLYAAWQAGVRPLSPYVEAQLPDGSWQKITGEAGFPAGLERTIVIDLTGRLPAGAHTIRLMTNLEIFWDQVLIDQSSHAAFTTAELPLAQATLHFRGYPTQLEGKSPGDLNYDYDRVSLSGPFQHQQGAYTRMGDVTPLLAGIDDRMVIFGSGEEIAAEFDTARLPALPHGWKRDYFFYANGFVKDMDWWDASPYTVAQLPFHAMSQYPYSKSEAFPEDKLDYQLDWNTRFDSGEPVRSYRFNYQQLPATPAQDSCIDPTGVCGTR
jgi:tetratricopeptide (TPR) repeat protein